ncbi:hypothetical protein [Algoriphagus sp. Y33]|nr:hypothetical protein [Algoriphagus sp. Y33]
MNIDDTQERAVPSLATALVDHGKLDITYQELDDMIRDDEKTNLY